MKKYFITVEWNHGFVHTYDVVGGEPGSRSDAVHDAKMHLNAARNIKSYIIKDEEGSVIYDKRRDNPKA
jgi:hypothetical protein